MISGRLWHAVAVVEIRGAWEPGRSPVPPALARNVVVVWGQAGRDYLDRLPEQIVSVCRDWGLTLGAAYDMSFHWVCAVRRADGVEAVLKLGVPATVDMGREIATLRHYDGVGAVRLLAYDHERGALLLERAAPGTAASIKVPRMDHIATAAIITVMRGLHRPLEASVDLPDIHSRDAKSFVEHLRRYPADDPFPRRLAVRALGLLEELCADSTSRVVLHGDLHHGNVLRASDRQSGWLAIDPHGVVGDRAAEVGAMLYNPDPPRRDPELAALVPARVEQLADGLGLPEDRVVAWGFVQAVLSEVWTAEEQGAPVTRAIDVALTLEPALA
jgi:streptomycin 6-kinase